MLLSVVWRTPFSTAMRFIFRWFCLCEVSFGNHGSVFWVVCMLIMMYCRGGGQSTAREGILCVPQGSHTYIESIYLESMLKQFYRLDYKSRDFLPHVSFQNALYSTGNDDCVISVAIKFSMWPSVENVCPPLIYWMLIIYFYWMLIVIYWMNAHYDFNFFALLNLRLSFFSVIYLK